MSDRAVRCADINPKEPPWLRERLLIERVSWAGVNKLTPATNDPYRIRHLNERGTSPGRTLPDWKCRPVGQRRQLWSRAICPFPVQRRGPCCCDEIDRVGKVAPCGPAACELTGAGLCGR